MSLIHNVYDTDKHFSVNTSTRELTNQTPEKTQLMQGDHNSERISFNMPRYVEGHDMTVCNVIQVHYVNIDTKTKEEKLGLYDVVDIQVSPEDENVAVFTWLVSANATSLVGSLHFRITFKCVKDGIDAYRWNTEICKELKVSKGITNSECFDEDCADFVSQWEERIKALEAKAADTFVAHYGETTFNEIVAAYAANKVCVAKNASSGITMTLANCDADVIRFFHFDARNWRMSVFEVDTSSKWSTKTYAFATKVDDVLPGTNGVIKLNHLSYDAQTLTEEQKAQARQNIGAESETFVAVYGSTTFQAIADAYNAGKVCVAKNHTSGRVAVLTNSNADVKRFFRYDALNKYLEIWAVDQESNWTSSVCRFVMSVDGAAPGSDGKVTLSAVSYAAQNLTEEQKAQARQNIGVTGSGGGDNGKDGVSPIISVSAIEGGHRITITDAEGEKYVDVMDGVDGYTPKKGTDYFDGEDGQPGKDGAAGQPGKDGVSPTVAVSKSGKVTTVKITDATGTKTATINDGADGKDGSNGQDGSNGKDGTSPTVAVSAIDGGHRITITDVNGTKTVDVMDGVSAASGAELPSYYTDYLPDKMEQVKTLMDEAGGNGTAFIMFSDSHMELAGSGVNGGNSGKLAQKVMDECRIPFALYFGDAGSNSPQETEELCTESLEAFNTMVKPLEGRLFQILGNHDGAWGLPADIDGDGTVDSSTESYPYNMSREKTFHRALQKNRLNPRAVMSANGAYYYIDDSGSRTRFLMLNTNDKPYLTNENGTMKTEGNTMKGTMMRQAQIDWIVASLESVPEGWDVIACTHHPLHQNTVTVGQYVRGIFKAFRDKSTYSATYAGEYSEGGGAAYTNQLAVAIDSDGTVYNGQGWRADYRLNSSGAVVAGTGWYVTGFMPCKAGDVIRLQDAGLDPAGGYLNFFDDTFTRVGGGGATSALGTGGSQHDSYKVSLDANGHVAQFTVPSNSSIAYFRYSTQTAFTDASIVTVNEEIVETPGTSIDGLEISVDFSTNKGGDFIALFDGHAHNDYHYTAASFLVDMIAIACDGRISNCSYMEDETYENRALGTVYEQCLDVVVVNKAARTIQTVRIGAGENREISY